MVVVRKLIIFILATILLFFAHISAAETMFEGYYKVMSGGVPVGYLVQKYELDSKSKKFTSTYFLKTNSLGNNVTESLKAEANEKFGPLSYAYTSQVGDKIKTIDATFKGDTMKLTIMEDGKNSTKTVKLPKGAFMSTFLGYMMLHQGYKTGNKYSYKGIAEEDGQVFSGEAEIKTSEKRKGLEAFKIFNKFKGSEFISYVTAKGEVVETKSPVQQIATELVAKRDEALKGFSLPEKNLRAVFGSVPTGGENELTKLVAKAPTPEPILAKPTKTEADTPTAAEPTVPPMEPKKATPSAQPTENTDQ